MSLAVWAALAACLWAIDASAQFRFGGSFYGGGFEGGDTHTTLSIQADGACRLTTEMVQPRKTLELWVRNSERASEMGEEEGEETPPAKGEQKPLTDQELAAKLLELYREQPAFDENSTLKVEAVEGNSNSVRTVTTTAFPSIKELLTRASWSWGPTLLMYENARFEIDTNHHFRLSLVPSKANARAVKTMARQWKDARVKWEWRLELPGKVLESGLPETQANATALRLDPDKPETADSVLKLVGAPVTVVAEPAGLKLDEPLESKKLMRFGWRNAQSTPDLPIVDAAPGFTTEPVSITLSTVHFFPEGKKALKGRPGAFGWQQPGTVVSAKLFPPRGRLIKSVSQVRVIKAADDKGRAVPEPGKPDEPEAGEAEADAASSPEEAAALAAMAETGNSFEFTANDQDKNGTARFDIHLGLPAADAQSIDHLEGEAVALTFAKWNELVLTNVQADATKEIDLAEILPGAKVIIKKVKSGQQTSVDAQLTGPATVGQVDVKIKFGGRNNYNSSNMSVLRSSSAGGKTTLGVRVQGWHFEPTPGGGVKNGPVTLLLRFPQDLKRERVKFTLAALDLL